MKTNELQTRVVLAFLLFVAGTGQTFGVTFTTVDYPLAANTEVHDVSGSTIVGSYWAPVTNLSHGFLYDGVTFTTVDYPLAANTEIFGISGSTVFGAYREPFTNLSHGFVAQNAVPEPSASTLVAIAVCVSQFMTRRIARSLPAPAAR